MAATQRSLILIVYAPALAVGDNRPLAVVHGLERAFPGLRLEWTISDEGRLVPLPQRDDWVMQRRDDWPGFPLVCNGGDERFRVTTFGLEILPSAAPGGRAQFDVHAELPLDAAGIAAAMDVLEAVAEGARAFWGHVSPDGYGEEIARQTSRSEIAPDVSPRGLPALKRPWDIPLPEIPQFLGWLNYWSAATAHAIGFPDSTRDTDLLARARRTATGGWVVRITDEPLDFENPAHLDALLRAYERFPRIGGRTTS